MGKLNLHENGFPLGGHKGTKMQKENSKQSLFAIKALVFVF